MDVVSGAASQIFFFFFPAKSGGRGRGPAGRVQGQFRIKDVGEKFFFARARVHVSVASLGSTLW